MENSEWGFWSQDDLDSAECFWCSAPQCSLITLLCLASCCSSVLTPTFSLLWLLGSELASIGGIFLSACVMHAEVRWTSPLTVWVQSQVPFFTWWAISSALLVSLSNTTLCPPFHPSFHPTLPWKLKVISFCPQQLGEQQVEIANLKYLLFLLLKTEQSPILSYFCTHLCCGQSCPLLCPLFLLLSLLYLEALRCMAGSLCLSATPILLAHPAMPLKWQELMPNQYLLNERRNGSKHNVDSEPHIATSIFHNRTVSSHSFWHTHAFTFQNLKEETVFTIQIRYLNGEKNEDLRKEKYSIFYRSHYINKNTLKLGCVSLLCVFITR